MSPFSAVNLPFIAFFNLASADIYFANVFFPLRFGAIEILS